MSRNSATMLAQNSESLTPSSSPGTTQQKRKRSSDELLLLSSSAAPSYSHPFINKPYSSSLHSLTNSHDSVDNMLHSQQVDHDPDRPKMMGRHNHSQNEGMNGRDGGRENFEDDEDEGEEDDEDEGEDDGTQSSTPRVENNSSSRPMQQQGTQLVNVKSEPATEGFREGVSPLPASALPSSIEVKPGVLAGGGTGTIQTTGAYCFREEVLKKEEDSGRLKFVCHWNDGVDLHMMMLIGLKSIYSRQLPNMPKEYIVRLVMDRSHKSMMITKNGNVVGGVTYRPYLGQKFGEIAFLAITGEEQVKGYGTRLMNHLKKYARDNDGLTHFLTYADNNAVDYFTKQGFTKDVGMEKERWKGYIKDYDGGTLMECRIDPKLPYTDLPAMIRRQRQAIDEKIREISNCHVVRQGIEISKKEYGVPRKPPRIEDIPGVREAGWAPDQSASRIRLVNATSEGPPTKQSLNTFMRSLLKVVVEHADAWPFKEPVDAREVPDYYEVIKDPVDLRTLSKRLDSEQYFVTLDMFAADMMRMLSNARTYNSPDTVYYKAANRLETFFKNKLQAGIQGSNRPLHT